MKQKIVQHGDYELWVNIREWDSKTNGTRVYVGSKLVELHDTAEPKASDFPGETIRAANGRTFTGDDVLYTERDAYPNVDKAWDRFNRRIVEAQRDVILRALDGAPGIDVPDEYVFAFSKYAGCTCPCSPGFVVKHERRATRLRLDGELIDQISIYRAGDHAAMLAKQAEAKAKRRAERVGGDVHAVTKPIAVTTLIAVLDQVSTGKLTADDAFTKLNKS